MILDVFPSYKDKNMVDMLYRYERDTRLSLNILVENYLEKLLYEKGYFAVENTDGEIITPKQEEPKTETGFKTTSQGNTIRLHYYIDDKTALDFSSHKPDLIDEIKEKLLNSNKLKELCVDNYGKHGTEYKAKLYYTLGISLDYLKDPFMYWDKRLKRHCVKKTIDCDGEKKQFSFGEFKNKKDAGNVRNFMISRDWDTQYSFNEWDGKKNKYIPHMISLAEEEKRLREGEIRDGSDSETN